MATYQFPAKTDFTMKFFAALDKCYYYEASKVIDFLEDNLAGKSVTEYLSYGAKAQNKFIEYMGSSGLGTALILTGGFAGAVNKALSSIAKQ